MANRISLKITKPDNTDVTIAWLKQDAVNNNWDPFYNHFQIFYYRLIQPYLVGRIQGFNLAKVGRYHFSATVYDANNQKLDVIEADQDFLPTKDLCIMVSRLWGPPIEWSEIYEAQRAMLRLSTLMPVRDGLSYLDGGNRTAGLRYNFDFNPYPFDQNLGQLYDKYMSNLTLILYTLV